MAGVLQHLRSSTLDKRPNPASMVDGQVAINYASGAPGMFFKDSNGALVKVGPVHVGSGAPNAVPASGGTAGNSLGEQWLDTSGGTYVFKIWDGSAWRSEAGEFVNVTGDTMTGALGIIAGSAGSPSLFISGDANTGLYSPGADQLAISTNGTGRLFVDASGNVQIGSSTSTGARVDITGSSDIFSFGSTSRRLYAWADSGGVSLLTGDTQTGNGFYIDELGSNIRFWTGSTERMRLDSSGRLGLGTSSAGDILHVKGGSTYAGVIADNSATTGGGAFRAYRNGVQKAIFCVDSWVTGTSSDDAAIYADAGGGIKFYTNNSSTAKAYLTSGGSLGIGTTSPGVLLDLSAATAATRITSSTGTNPAYTQFINTAGNAYIGIESSTGGGAAVGNAPYALHLSHQGAYPINFSTNNALRATIDSSGRLLVGTSTGVDGALVRVEGGISINGVTNTSAVNSAGHYISPVVNSAGLNTCKSATNDTSGAGDLWQYSRINSDGVIFNFHRGTASVGTVSITSSATSYNTSSDYRLKENVVPLTGAIDRVNQLQVHRFNFIADPDKTVDGFIAHEAQAVVPECVTGTKDKVDANGNPVYQGIDQSKLVPLLTAALQEALQKIEDLEGRLTAAGL